MWLDMIGNKEFGDYRMLKGHRFLSINYHKVIL